MAIKHSPRIVTDGLVVHYDAANTKSYPGSGTTWKDLSGKGNNGTIYGATFGSDNIGNIVFDGSNDYVSTSSLNVTLSRNCSILFWFKDNNPDNWTDIFTFQTGDDNTASRVEKNGTVAYQYNWYRSGFVPGTILFNHTGTKYDFISLVFDDTNATCYQNAVQTVQTASSDFGSASVIHFGKRLTGQYWTGNIAQVSIYNRALTATEVLQNYQALKERYL